jgi:hypothetical protein
LNVIENKPVNPSPAPAPASPVVVSEGSLQGQINFLLIMMVILTATVSIFMLRQVLYMKRDLAALRPTAAQVIQNYRQEAPMLDAFVAKLAEYGRTHPDFAPVAQKYQLQNYTNAPAATAPKPGTPVTPATPAPK